MTATAQNTKNKLTPKDHNHLLKGTYKTTITCTYLLLTASLKYVVIDVNSGHWNLHHVIIHDDFYVYEYNCLFTSCI